MSDQVEIQFDLEVDARGLSCPMPVVKARQALKELEPGQVLRVVATDRGSIKDFQGWAQSASDFELLAQHEVEEEGRKLYLHYLRKTA